MRWLTLESKMLSAVAYDDSKQILYLRFRNTGDVYRYFHFPAAEYQAFLGAESKGRIFRSQVRDHFRYERMAKTSTPPDFVTTVRSRYPHLCGEDLSKPLRWILNDLSAADLPNCERQVCQQSVT